MACPHQRRQDALDAPQVTQALPYVGQARLGQCRGFTAMRAIVQPQQLPGLFQTEPQALGRLDETHARNVGAGVAPDALRGARRRAQQPRELIEADRLRMHYQQYLGSRRANDDLWHPPQGLREFLRQFFHVKSGDWPGNEPHPLKSMAATEFARMPAYYVMEQGKTMPETVAALQRSHAAPTACGWLTETELGVYAREYERTGFQGALQGYRVVSDAELNSELRLFSGRTIDVPSLFIGGTRDWGPYAAPGALDVMRTKAATKLLGIELIQDAGHWIQQEKPSQLGTRLIEFLDEVGSVVP